MPAGVLIPISGRDATSRVARCAPASGRTAGTRGHGGFFLLAAGGFPGRRSCQSRLPRPATPGSDGLVRASGVGQRRHSERASPAPCCRAGEGRNGAGRRRAFPRRGPRAAAAHPTPCRGARPAVVVRLATADCRGRGARQASASPCVVFRGSSPSWLSPQGRRSHGVWPAFGGARGGGVEGIARGSPAFLGVFGQLRRRRVALGARQ
ncbi:MAG: hypothetical protein KatS3mg131_1265 [Candidatus Tectimicrobiota bacterium]|nr:MAG: hypothetical protein KatS3mg131_1265 [Candidatus Tectomicrobia bacterium]